MSALTCSVFFNPLFISVCRDARESSHLGTQLHLPIGIQDIPNRIRNFRIFWPESYRSEGKNYKLGLSACRICTKMDRNFRRCRNVLSMYRCNFVHTDITNSLLIENFERRNLFFVALYFMYHLYYSAMLNEFLH